MMRLLTIAAFLVLAQSAGRPPVPFVDEGACPFEGCTYREWRANRIVRVHRERSTRSPVIFTVRTGEKVEALTGAVVTTAPGEARFREAVTLDAMAGDEHLKIHVEPGETLYLLTYEGEGYTTAWFEGRLYRSVDGTDLFNAACDTKPAVCRGHVVRQPQRTWWVQVRNGKGQVGWTNEPDSFDGKDQLAQ